MCREADTGMYHEVDTGTYHEAMNHAAGMECCHAE